MKVIGLSETIFTFFWADGRKEVLKGTTPNDALLRAGYDGHTVPDLHAYRQGNSRALRWCKDNKQWLGAKGD